MSTSLHRVSDVAEGLALEADAFAAEDSTALVWTSRTPALVCPASSRHKRDFKAATLRSGQRGWPVHLRPTGGGAVPQGPGVVNLALVLTVGRDFGIETGYRLITDVIRAALAPQGTELTAGATSGSFCDGAWNLSIRGQKIVGTAQRIRPLKGGWRRVLAHALILVEGDIGPGVGAVNGFHEGLGLPPVTADAHTTLAKALGPNAPDPTEIARKLVATTRMTLLAPATRIGA